VGSFLGLLDGLVVGTIGQAAGRGRRALPHGRRRAGPAAP